MKISTTIASAEFLKQKVWTRFVRFIDTEGRERCGEPEDPDVDGMMPTFDVRLIIILELFTVWY